MKKATSVIDRIVGGNKWARVMGTNPSPVEVAQREANVNTHKSQSFKDCCSNAGIPVTKRQASKYNNHKGAAYKTAKGIDMNGFGTKAS
jgi:hypothetical protein